PSLPGSIRSSSTRSGLAWWKAAMAWSPERTNTGSKPSCRRTIPSISPSDGSSSTTSTLPFTRYRPLPSTDNRPRMSCQRPTVEYPPSPQTSRTPLTGPCGLVTMRASADERKTVTSPPPPWEPPGQPSGQPGQPPAGPGQGAPGWGPPPAGPPGPPAWGPPPGAPGAGPPARGPGGSPGRGAAAGPAGVGGPVAVPAAAQGGVGADRPAATA